MLAIIIWLWYCLVFGSLVNRTCVVYSYRLKWISFFSSLFWQWSWFWTSERDSPISYIMIAFSNDRFCYFSEWSYPVVCSHIWHCDRDSPVHDFLMPLHKKWSFPLMTFSVNVTKSAVSCAVCVAWTRNPLTMTPSVNILDNFLEFCLFIHVVPPYFEQSWDSNDSVEIFHCSLMFFVDFWWKIFSVFQFLTSVKDL